MKILAAEFSSGQRSVAVAVDGEVRGSAMEAATRATPAFAMIERALAEARIEREEIECLAVGLGPGSYTGIRAAIALAQGWALARPVKLLGIGSVECLAAEAEAKGWQGRVSFIIDAQRGELYLARRETGTGVGRELEPLRLAAVDEVRTLAAAGEIVAGPEAERWFPEGRVLIPGAAVLARLAAGRTDFAEGERLAPIYLRETNFVKAAPLRILPAG